jgi:hypothetical protein
MLVAGLSSVFPGSSTDDTHVTDFADGLYFWDEATSYSPTSLVDFL